MKHFVFLRHAESEKNIKDITGGKGEPLTEKGIKETDLFINYLSGIVDSKCNIICMTSNTKQTIQTAKLISDYFGVEVLINDAFQPIGLGCLDGLTTDEIKKNHPNYYLILRDWRKKKIDVTKLKIDGIESPIVPWKRVINCLYELEDDTTYFIVCTRSIMVLIYNYVNGNEPFSGSYCHHDIKNCGKIVFDYSNKSGVSNVVIDV